MKLFYAAIILFVGVLSACLSGCHEKSTTILQSNETAVYAKDAKPGAAIKLISGSLVSVNANELTQIELLFDVKEPTGTLNIELSSTNGLEVVDTPIHQNIDLTPSMSIKVPVKLRAVADGRYYLNIHAEIDTDDSVSSRNLALIVQVGAEQEKSVQFKKTAGDNVIRMPAQETISNQ